MMDENSNGYTSSLDDPEKISDSKLRAIISEVGIELPKSYQTRSYLVSVYNANKSAILEHFKRKHRRKSDSSVVMPDDIPVDPYVEAAPDLGATAPLLSASKKRPAQPQEAKVDKKKVKKANPFQTVYNKIIIDNILHPALINII